MGKRVRKMRNEGWTRSQCEKQRDGVIAVRLREPLKRETRRQVRKQQGGMMERNRQRAF